MPKPLTAGLNYFALVFSAAFLIGVLRTLVVAPAIGETAAVLAEVPIVLALSWLFCRWVTRHIPVPALQGRVMMGILAFVLLMAAELLLAVLIAHRTVAGHFALYRTAPALIGLLGQIGFAVIPSVQLWQNRR